MYFQLSHFCNYAQYLPKLMFCDKRVAMTTITKNDGVFYSFKYPHNTYYRECFEVNHKTKRVS